MKRHYECEECGKLFEEREQAVECERKDKIYREQMDKIYEEREKFVREWKKGANCRIVEQCCGNCGHFVSGFCNFVKYNMQNIVTVSCHYVCDNWKVKK